jgi:hypothetical protein
MDDLVLAVVILLVLMLIQLVEEIRKDIRTVLPLGEMPKNIFILVKVLVYLFAGITLALVILGSPAAVVLAWILAFAMMANGLWLLTQLLVESGYYPGGYTAIFVLASAIYLMVVLI